MAIHSLLSVLFLAFSLIVHPQVLPAASHNAATSGKGPVLATPAPTTQATVEPTAQATVEPTAQATAEPTAQATAEPTAQATAEPTAQATAEPTAQATAEPTAQPTPGPAAPSTGDPAVQSATDAAVAATSTFVLKVSMSPDRSNSVDLNGQTVTGKVYVFVSPESGASRVDFYIDNTSASGTPFHTENGAPWDFAGGNSSANPYDTAQLSKAGHSITAAVSLSGSGKSVITANFTVTGAYSNLVSKSPDRSGASALDGQTVSGNMYVFVSPASGVQKVDFYIDNTSASGTPFHTENMGPWDLNGGADTAATAYDTHKLSNGYHTITAAVTVSSISKIVTTAKFTVANAATGSIYWGANIYGVPSDINKLSTWEQNVAGKHASIIHWGQNWANGSSYQSWSNTAANNARNHGSIPMLSWNPDGGDDAAYQLLDIANGNHDAYLKQYATDVKNWGKPIFIRMMHEMNGNWFSWSEDTNGNHRGDFVKAWKHVVDVFRANGANNVSWVWCPNFVFPGTSPWPSFASLYPGDSYVDWTCLDGYNWGSNKKEGWQSFSQIFSYSYGEILKVAPSKPMMIGETGSVEQGGSKATWFTDTLSTQLPVYFPKVRAFVYFNWQMSGVDWRVESSSAAQSAFKSGIANGYYAANNYGSITGKPPVP